MTAIEFLKARDKMTKGCTILCSDCPLGMPNNGSGMKCSEFENECPEKAIEIVEKWAKERPIKTRQSEFQKLFPTAPLGSDGVISLSPCHVVGLAFFSNEHCRETGCYRCTKEFWLEEIE